MQGDGSLLSQQQDSFSFLPCFCSSFSGTPIPLEICASRSQGVSIPLFALDVLPKQTSDGVLQEASDDGSLGDAPFKLLNIGLSGASLAHILVLAPLLGSDSAGPFLPVLLGIWGTSLAVSGVNLLKSSQD